MKKSSVLFVTAMSFLFVSAYADEDLTEKMQKGREVYKAEQDRIDREQMRDKSHDNRASVEKNTSLGIDGGKDPQTGEVRGELNVRKTY